MNLYLFDFVLFDSRIKILKQTKRNMSGSNNMKENTRKFQMSENLARIFYQGTKERANYVSIVASIYVSLSCRFATTSCS